MASSTPSPSEATGGEPNQLATIRQAVTTRLATLVPPSDRRAVVERWAEVGDEFAREVTEAEAEIKELRAQLDEADAAMALVLKETETLKEYIKLVGDINPSDAMHPELGQLVRDMGYKRVYCASVRQLAAVPIWEMQRILRQDRAAAIATEKRKKGFPVKIPGIITLYALPDGTYKLLDGQHRLAALRLLAESGIVNGDSNYILVEVFHLEKPSEVKELFMEINRAQPVKLVDLPDEARPDFKMMVNGATETLRQKYEDMFKASTNCKIPHVNIDNLRDDIYQHGVSERHGIKTAEELVAWLEKANATLGQKSDKDWNRLYKGRNMDVVERAVAKARKSKFYLGLDRTWLSL